MKIIIPKIMLSKYETLPVRMENICENKVGMQALFTVIGQSLDAALTGSRKRSLET